MDRCRFVVHPELGNGHVCARSDERVNHAHGEPYDCHWLLHRRPGVLPVTDDDIGRPNERCAWLDVHYKRVL
jgi:hypothetical protein